MGIISQKSTTFYLWTRADYLHVRISICLILLKNKSKCAFNFLNISCFGILYHAINKSKRNNSFLPRPWIPNNGIALEYIITKSLY